MRQPWAKRFHPFRVMVIVKKDLPVNSLKELIAYIKERPGKVIYGSQGAGAFLVGNHCCCCVRVCQSPVLTRALAGGGLLHPG